MKRTRLNPISAKRRSQLLKENELKKILFKKQGGLCADCHGVCDWRGFEKHEVIYRSRGGDATNESNCRLVCAKCHSAHHLIYEH